MSLKPSPGWLAMHYYLAEEFVRGDEKDSNNPFFWDKIIINAIGNKDFNPSLQWVFKYNSILKIIAGDVRFYVDNLRAVGWSMEHAWLITRVLFPKLQFLGIQDAPQKRRIDEGPWSGTIYQANSEEVNVTITEKKWNKSRDHIQQLIMLTG